MWDGPLVLKGVQRVADAVGERGVDHVLLLDADVRRTMALVGARTVEDLDAELVETAAGVRSR